MTTGARVLLATSAEWPDLFVDEHPLRDELRARGVDARAAIWDDPSVEWADADLVVLRSIWDYTWKRGAFVAWARAVERVARLHNPARIVEWNSHKAYLKDLEERGVRIIPTVWADARSSLDVAAVAAERGWDQVVAKPCVSAGARATVRGDPATVQRHVDELLPDRDMMLQPYVAATEDIGEHALVYFGNEPSHAVRKEPAMATAEYSSSRVTPVEPHDDELRLARQVLDIVGPLLYARVDCVVIEERAHLMELEVIEPQLFFRAAPGSESRMADLIVGALERGATAWA